MPEINSLTQLSRSTVTIEAHLGIIAHSEALFTNFTMGWKMITFNNRSFVVFNFIAFFSLFVATVSYRRRSHGCRRIEWVSEQITTVTIEFWSSPNFDPMFPGATYCLFWNSTEDNKHSQSFQDDAWKKKYCSFWQKYLKGVIDASRKRIGNIFSLKRKCYRSHA